MQEISDSAGIVQAACQIMDRCNPNPCEHRGICKQNSQEFFCDCEGTGYTGAVCHSREFSTVVLNCEYFYAVLQIYLECFHMPISSLLVHHSCRVSAYTVGNLSFRTSETVFSGFLLGYLHWDLLFIQIFILTPYVLRQVKNTWE